MNKEKLTPEENTIVKIATNVFKLRTMKELTQSKFARLLGTSKKVIEKLESGEF